MSDSENHSAWLGNVTEVVRKPIGWPLVTDRAEVRILSVQQGPIVDELCTYDGVLARLESRGRRLSTESDKVVNVNACGKHTLVVAKYTDPSARQ